MGTASGGTEHKTGDLIGKLDNNASGLHAAHCMHIREWQADVYVKPQPLYAAASALTADFTTSAEKHASPTMNMAASYSVL